MDSRPIGIFDSGIGGLTVVKEVRRVLPRESIVYIGDTARVPYGTRGKTTIARFALEITRLLLEKNVKALVVACNTISSTCLPEISQVSPVPVLGVIEPTVAEALQHSASRNIAVIGTAATIRSGVYERQLKMVEPQARVLSLATPLFVPIVEEGLKDHAVTDLMVKTYLALVKDDPGIDVLILGCTHYPLIRDSIQRFLGERIKVLDSARPTARALRQLLAERRLESDHTRPAQIFFTSDDPEKSMTIARDFLGDDLELQKISI